VPGLDAQQANLQSIDIGTARIGPISVGELVLSNTDFTMSAVSAKLHNMDVDVTLQIALEWGVGVHIDDIINFSTGGTWNFPDIHFHLPASLLGDVEVGPLNNIKVNIPELKGQNMSVDADPLSLHLNNAAAEQIHAQSIVLPSAGFTIAGLTLNSVQGTAVTVPAAKLDSATIGHLHGDPVRVPTFGLSNLKLPAAHTDLITNDTPLTIPMTLDGPTPPPGFDAGVLLVVLHITTKVVAHVPHLVISGVDASANVGQIKLNNVTLPYDVLNLTLSQIGLNTIGVPAFNVS
jgi:hypothetical protein